MTFAVTGASGQLGRLVLKQLKRRTDSGNIVALARSPEKVADTGVSARPFDYTKPDQLAPALAGVKTLLLISSSEVGQRTTQHKNAIEAAVTAGVSRIVYTSILRADTSDNPLAEEHKITENMLRDSGLAHTILRNGWYCENYQSAVSASLEHGAVIGSAGEGRISAAARRDYAEAAAVVMIEAGHENKVYELAGDDAFTMAEFAGKLSDLSGKAVPYVNLPEADYAGALTGAGVPEPFAKLLARADVTAASGSLHDGGHALSRLIGRPTTPITETISAALA